MVKCASRATGPSAVFRLPVAFAVVELLFFVVFELNGLESGTAGKGSHGGDEKKEGLHGLKMCRPCAGASGQIVPMRSIRPVIDRAGLTRMAPAVSIHAP